MKELFGAYLSMNTIFFDAMIVITIYKDWHPAIYDISSFRMRLYLLGTTLSLTIMRQYRERIRIS